MFIPAAPFIYYQLSCPWGSSASLPFSSSPSVVSHFLSQDLFQHEKLWCLEANTSFPTKEVLTRLGCNPQSQGLGSYSNQLVAIMDHEPSGLENPGEAKSRALSPIL